jgi:hypothetical protein
VPTATPAAQLVVEDPHAFFRVGFPLDPTRPLGRVGTWKVWVESLAQPGGFPEELRYSVIAKDRSDLLLTGRVLQTGNLPGSLMGVELEASLSGQPQALDEPVLVEVTRPDGAVRTQQLGRRLPGSTAEPSLRRGGSGRTASTPRSARPRPRAGG